MKVLIATGLYSPEIGGPATYTAFLEKHLPAHGVTCEVLPFSTVRKYPKLVGHFMYMFKLIGCARQVDMLYALDTVSVGLPVLFASLVTRTPYLLRVPGDYAWEQGSIRFGITETLDEYSARKGKDVPLRVRLLAWVQKLVAYNALHIVTPSEYLKRIVVGWGVPEGKVTRIYSALKTIQCTEDRRTLRNKYAYDGFVIATACRLVPWKGVRALIEALQCIRNDGINARLEIFGDGVCRAELEAYTGEVSLTPFVTFHGALSREEMAPRIKAADVFVLNTSYEGLSHQLLEVMSIGTPIITTPIGGNTELIKDGKSGVFVSYNNVEDVVHALKKLQGDEKLRTDLSLHAQKEVNKFHEDAVVLEFVRLLHTIWKF